jgi:long-chain acyl-CoA synthetase
MRLTQTLQAAALHHGGRIATVYGARKRTYADVLSRVARLAAGLREMGAQPGDRIAIIALNSDRYVEVYFAIAWAGCVSVPGNTRWSEAEHAFALDNCGPRLLLVDRAFAALGQKLMSRAPDRIVYLDDGPAPAGLHDVETIIAANDMMADRCTSGDALAVIFYTGGTTGHSKGVMLSHDGLIVNFLAMNLVAPYGPHPVFLHSPPMFHLADAAAIIGITIMAGTHVIVPGFDPVVVVRAIREHGVTALVLVPTMIGMLDAYVREKGADLGSVSELKYGASPISVALLHRALEMFPNARLCQAYGQTELSPVATILPHEWHKTNGPEARLLRSAGRAIPGVEVRIVDPDMNTVPAGSVGEIAVRGPNVMLGYWKNPDLTAKTIVDGWLRTGDAGYMDAEGFLFIVDRVKDMIVSGGENVYSAEVENALAQHPAVLECAVIGVPDSKWGERVHAFIRFREGAAASEDELIVHCESVIASYKRPRSFTIRTDPLPLSGAGKILKTELRKPFWADHGRNIG